MKKAIVELKSISFSRNDQHILNDINLSVLEGEFVVIIGPNGSGKSTLMKMLNGFVVPDQGDVLINEKSIANYPIHTIAQYVATLTQDLASSTFSELSVYENLQLALARSKSKYDRNSASQLLNSFSSALCDRLDVVVGSLSGGQRQALALAMCFAHTPKLLLLDEHTSALDPKAATTLMKYTNDHIKERNMTTIMVTHNLEHALAYGDRLIALHEGKVVADIVGDEKRNLTISQLFEKAY